MTLYKAAPGLLIVWCVVVFAVLVCSGSGLTYLPGGENPDGFSVRSVSVKADAQAEQKGFLIGSSRGLNEGLCVDVEQGHFWEHGVKPRVLQDTLIRNFRLYLSARYIPRQLIGVSSALVGEFLMLDSFGNVVGSYSAPFTACFSTVPLPDGCYDVGVRETGVSGNGVAYGFEMCVNKKQRGT